MIKTERHKIICNKLNEIYKNKNHDYGDSFGETFKKLGIISATTRIYDKCQRLLTLSTQEAKIESETIKDTLIDIANYAIMTLIELEQAQKQEQELIKSPLSSFDL